ncbi:MAG: hypothetical protein GX033_00810 [Firmicutes bacterium]|nr:hypothetical protein [Bacillota bacterium]
MDTITLWFFMAFTVERIVELVLILIPRLDKKQVLGVDVPVLLSFVLSLILAFGARLDFFEIVNVEFAWSEVGTVLSAVFMVGGATVLHDILGWINASKINARINGY